MFCIKRLRIRKSLLKNTAHEVCSECFGVVFVIGPNGLWLFAFASQFYFRSVRRFYYESAIEHGLNCLAGVSPLLFNAALINWPNFADSILLKNGLGCGTKIVGWNIADFDNLIILNINRVKTILSFKPA